MPDMDDYFAYKITTGKNKDSGSPGCFGTIVLWGLVIYGILSIAAEIIY